MSDLEVVICGGGPAGLTLAAELGSHGVRCAVIERHTTPSPQPRAKLSNVRTMEIMRRLGLADEIRRRAPLPAGYPANVVFATRLLGYQITRFPNAFDCESSHDERFPESAQTVPQRIVEQVLRDHLAGLDTVEVRTGHMLTGLEQLTDEVVCKVESPLTGKRESVSARWLIGADGGRSTVRQLLGIKMSGIEAIAQNVGLVIKGPGLAERHRLDPAVQYWLVNRDAPSVMGPLDGRDLWFFQATATGIGDYRRDIDVESYVTAAVGAPFEHEIVARDPWTAAALIAERYQDGRVFLIGDAAHLHPPMGGFGMNMGIADALDLGWKLAATVEGWGGDELLESYETERRPVHRMVIDEAVSNYSVLSSQLAEDGLETPGPPGDAIRAEVDQRIRADKAKEFYSLGVTLGYHYGESAAVIADGTATRPGTVQTYEPSSAPGYRSPHVWLDHGEHALYDECRDGFVLVCSGPVDVAPQWRSAALARTMPLTVVSPPPQRVRRWYPEPLTLVRPDAHVAWRGSPTTDPATVLDRARGCRGRQAVSV